MEWFRRNPKKAAGLSALAVLCLVILVWGMSGGSAKPAQDPTLGLPSSPLAMPAKCSTHALTGLAAPSASPTSVEQAIAAFPSAGMGNIGPGLAGSGGSFGLPPHRVVIEAGSDGPLLGVGWRIPTANGPRKGKDLSYKNWFRHSTTAFGKPDYAQLYTRVGPDSSVVWCTVTVDGKVTEHQESHGPWGGVFCQG